MLFARRLSLALASLFGVLSLPSPAASVTDYPAANLVLGQKVFTTNDSPTPASPGVQNLPASVAVDPTSGKVFVADQGNNRVLRYSTQAALKNGAAPDVVIGQKNFSSSAANQGLAAPSETSLSGPGSVFVDASGRLWIADTGNNRVLLFENAASISNLPPADRVYGQPDFATATAAPTAKKFAAPAGVCVDPAGTLWVADTGSHRVLGFKRAATLANGPTADRVLGQTTFTGNTAGTTQRTFFSPTGVSADATHLWVADRDNNRVLEFPNFPSIDGAPAGLVLGQTTYISGTPATSATGLTGPTGVFVSGANLWVADSANNRILRYADTATLTKGAAASTVVGQANFLTGSAGLSAKNLSLYTGNQIWVDATSSLWVADTLNNRVLRFLADAPPTIRVTSSRRVTTTKSKITIRGTAADDIGVRRVSYELGDGPFNRCVGTTNWTATFSIPVGRTRITIQSVDTNEKASAKAFVVVTRELP